MPGGLPRINEQMASLATFILLKLPFIMKTGGVVNNVKIGWGNPGDESWSQPEQSVSSLSFRSRSLSFLSPRRFERCIEKDAHPGGFSL